MSSPDRVLRVALFVEGSFGIPNRALIEPVRALWCDTIAASLGLQPPHDVIPISKAHIAELRHNDPTLAAATGKRPAISGAKEPLDRLIARWLKTSPFDAAIVAWDLVPRLNHLARTCRWQETVELHRLLALSKSLPPAWKEAAQARFHELSSRPSASRRQAPPVLTAGAVVAVCMEPMFEGLFADERALRVALGMRGMQSRDWPARWDPLRLDKELVGPAIEAARRAGVKLPVRGGFQENKDAWGQFLFGKMLADPVAGTRLREHPIVRRLCEVMHLATPDARKP